MIQETDLAWLAGFLDADGCFTCQVYIGTSSKNSYVVLKPYLTIKQSEKNGEKFLVKKVSDIYKKIGCKHTIRKSKTKNGYISYDISVATYSSVKRVIEKVGKYLTVKKDIAELILKEFPQGTFTRAKILKRNNLGHVKTTKRVIDWECVYESASFVDKIRKLNTPSGKPSKGRSNVKWTGKRIIEFYKELEKTSI